jgi:phosphoribosylglycinamide formyltransferase-1
MSGSGTNTRKIIEKSKDPRSSYKVVLIFTDTSNDKIDKNSKRICHALQIAREYEISYEYVDILDFYKEHGQKSKKDLTLRPEFDKIVVEKIEPYKIDLIVLGGYMSITTKPLLDRYSGKIVNVHPADLSIKSGLDRKYVGIHTVRDAILEDEKEVRASTHIVREKVDHGEILIISKPVKITLPQGISISLLKENKELLNRVVEDYQSRLKEAGDWIILPLTVQMIGEGRFSLLDNVVYFDGKSTEYGLKLN